MSDTIYSLFEPIKFNIDQKEDIFCHLQDLGYVVIQNMIDSDLIQSLFKEDLREINRELPEDITLWNLRPGIDYPSPNMPGLVGEWGLSHGRAAWTVRCNKNIQDVFSYLLNTENLVCSTAAIGFSTDAEPESTLSWLHVDQNPHIYTPLGTDTQSLQGIVYAEDTYDISGATTVIVSASHKSWLSHNFKSSNHFEIVNQEIYTPTAHRLKLKAGDLLIYNSKTVHQGWHGPHRLCFMVSYGRKIDRTEIVRKNKILMYLSGYRSTHWSQLSQHHGYKLYNNTDKEFNILQPEIQIGNIPIMQQNYMTSIAANMYRAAFPVPPNMYTTLLDYLIPIDRLSLL